MSNTESNMLKTLDEALDRLDEADLKFMSAQTGIQDPEELRRHIVTVQKEIYAVRYCTRLCRS